MSTDWTLIRETMNAAIDVCEKLGALSASEDERGAAGEAGISVSDFLKSAWIYPENASYMIVRARHQLGDDKPYTPELARVVSGAARFCSELIGASNLDTPVTGIDPHQKDSPKSVRDLASDLKDWYKGHLFEGVSGALGNSRI